MVSLRVSRIALRNCDWSIPLTAGGLPSDTKSGAATSCDCNSRGTTAASLASTLSAAFWEFRIAQATEQPHADRNRVGLLESEHQRRQIKAAAQHIAEPGGPFDRHAARLQRGD